MLAVLIEQLEKRSESKIRVTDDKKNFHDVILRYLLNLGRRWRRSSPLSKSQGHCDVKSGGNAKFGGFETRSRGKAKLIQIDHTQLYGESCHTHTVLEIRGRSRGNR